MIIRQVLISQKISLKKNHRSAKFEKLNGNSHKIDTSVGPLNKNSIVFVGRGGGRGTRLQVDFQL